MKKIIAFLSTLILSIVLCACTFDTNGSYSRITIDVNPSIELIINNKNKVVTVTGLNTDGELVLVGEDFENKSVDDVAETYFENLVKLGYINQNDLKQKITISISDDKKNIYKVIKERAAKVFEEYDIVETREIEFKQGKAATTDEIITILEKFDSSKDYKSMKEKDLYGELSGYRKLTASLPKVIVDQYSKIKDLYDFANQVGQLVSYASNAFPEIQTILSDNGLTANEINSAITNIINEFKNYFFDQNGVYQAKRREVLTVKAELAGLKNELKKISPTNTEAYSAKETEINSKIAKLNQVENEFNAFNAKVETLVNEAHNYLNIFKTLIPRLVPNIATALGVDASVINNILSSSSSFGLSSLKDKFTQNEINSAKNKDKETKANMENKAGANKKKGK